MRATLWQSRMFALVLIWISYPPMTVSFSTHLCMYPFRKDIKTQKWWDNTNPCNKLCTQLSNLNVIFTDTTLVLQGVMSCVKVKFWKVREILKKNNSSPQCLFFMSFLPFCNYRNFSNNFLLFKGTYSQRKSSASSPWATLCSHWLHGPQSMGIKIKTFPEGCCAVVLCLSPSWKWVRRMAASPRF